MSSIRPHAVPAAASWFGWSAGTEHYLVDFENKALAVRLTQLSSALSICCRDTARSTGPLCQKPIAFSPVTPSGSYPPMRRSILSSRLERTVPGLWPAGSLRLCTSRAAQRSRPRITLVPYRGMRTLRPGPTGFGRSRRRLVRRNTFGPLRPSPRRQPCMSYRGGSRRRRRQHRLTSYHSAPLSVSTTSHAAPNHRHRR